jgi:Fe2+ or Zn2+ uptake regulation protein
VLSCKASERSEMGKADDSLAELLHARGSRVTPQRQLVIE